MVEFWQLYAACIEQDCERQMHQYVATRELQQVLKLLWPRLSAQQAETLLVVRCAEYEESVEQFIRRNLGDEVFERLIEPFCSGVYAGNPSKLSMQAAFNKVRCQNTTAAGADQQGQQMPGAGAAALLEGMQEMHGRVSRGCRLR